MGLGAKIKEVLHSDHQTTNSSSNTATPSTGNYNTPGSFPSDDLPQRHTDGKNYTAPHGTAVDDTRKTGTHTGATSGLTSSGTQRNRLSKGTDELDPSQERDSKFNAGHRTQDSAVHVDPVTGQDQASKGAYWGDLSKDGQRGATRDLPEHTRLGDTTSSTTGRHHDTKAGHHYDHRLTDQAVGGGVYDASPAQGSHGASNRDHTEDSSFGQGVAGTAGRHHGGPDSRENRLAGQPSGGGVYNSVTGSGSPERYGTRTGQTGNVHDPLSSGTKGVPLSSGSGSGNTYDQQNTGYRGGEVPTTQNERTGHGHGLGGAGAAAGVGAAAGYGAHEYGQHNKNSTNYGGNGSSGGVPRTSMLDPEPAFNNSTSHAAGQSAIPGHNDPVGSHGPHGSRVANAVDPRINESDPASHGTGAGAYSNTGGHSSHLPGGSSNINTNPGAASNFQSQSAASPTQSASSGSGRKHFGPGHEGAKVLHSCEHCGRDNDISHYFSKDVVYRLGQ